MRWTSWVCHKSSSSNLNCLHLVDLAVGWSKEKWSNYQVTKACTTCWVDWGDRYGLTAQMLRILHSANLTQFETWSSSDIEELIITPRFLARSTGDTYAESIRTWGTLMLLSSSCLLVPSRRNYVFSSLSFNWLSITHFLTSQVSSNLRNVCFLFFTLANPLWPRK